MLILTFWLNQNVRTAAISSILSLTFWWKKCLSPNTLNNNWKKIVKCCFSPQVWGSFLTMWDNIEWEIEIKGPWGSFYRGTSRPSQCSPTNVGKHRNTEGSQTPLCIVLFVFFNNNNNNILSLSLLLLLLFILY